MGNRYQYTPWVWLVCLLAVHVGQGTHQAEDIENELRIHEIPSAAQTAEKLHRYFLGESAKSTHPMLRLRNVKRRTRRFFKSESTYDVAFLIDASGSIKEKDFYKGLKALDLLIGKAKPSTKYAIVRFSEKADIISYFEWPPNKTRSILNTIEYQGYRTNTQDALHKCRVNLFMNTSSGVRRRSNKRVLIVTDGRSNIDNRVTLYMAAKLKNYHIQIFVLAVGQYSQGINELAEIATTRSLHLFRVQSMEGLIDVVKLIPPDRKRYRAIIT